MLTKREGVYSAESVEDIAKLVKDMEINEKASVVYPNARELDTKKVITELFTKYNVRVTINLGDLERKPNYIDITRTY